MLLQQFDILFNEHCCSPMDKSISKKQRIYLKHLQQCTSGKHHPTLKKQIPNKEKSCKDKPKPGRAKKSVRSPTKISSFLKRRLLKECLDLDRKAKVMLYKIDDCPDVNSVWIYDRSIAKYRWHSFSDVTSEEDNCDTETQASSEAVSNELNFVITEIRGNASDVFESVSFSSDAETEATLNYSEDDNAESDVDLGGIVEIYESYNPDSQGQNITVQIGESETVEEPLNHKIEPNERNNPVDKNEISDCENTCVNSLDVSSAQKDTIRKGRTKNGRISPFTRKVGGKKKRRRKRCLKKSVNVNKKSTSLYFRTGRGAKQKIERRNYTFSKAKRISRIGKHSKRFKEILNNAPRYWRSRAYLNATKKLINKVNTDDERKPAVPLKVRLLQTYHKFPETVNQEKEPVNAEDSKPEDVSSPKNLEENVKPVAVTVKRKNSKASKCPVEDGVTNQANSTDGVSTKRKTEKQENSSNCTTPDDNYSLLDQELPGYNWLEKKIKSGEIISPRRTSTAGQEINTSVCETTENSKVDSTNSNAKMEKEGITQEQLRDSIKESIPQEEAIKFGSQVQSQMEVPNSKLKEENLYSSQTKESSEVNSPESGVEIDLAPLSASDPEGDFLAQGIYLVINEGDINAGNNSYTDRDLMENKDSATEQLIEARNEKVQIPSTETECNEMQPRAEQEHICNNESCLLSAPERIRIGNRNNTTNSPEFSPPPVSWLKQAVLAEKKSTIQRDEVEIVATYSPISPSVSGNTSENSHAQEEKTVSNSKDSEIKDITHMNMSSITNSNSPNQESNPLSYNTNQNVATTSELQRETSIKNQSQEPSSFVSPNSASNHGVSETRIRMTSHIPVQQLNTNPSNVTFRKCQSEFYHGIPNLYGNIQTGAPVPPVNSIKHLSTSQNSPPQIPMNNLNYERTSQGYKGSFLRRSYERYMSPGTWASLYSSQVSYGPNFNGAIEPVCQISEPYTANSTLQNEKNFTISSLLELQSASAQSNAGLQTNTKMTTIKPSEVSNNGDVHKTHLNETTSEESNKEQSSTLRAHLEGNSQRPKLPEPPSSDINRDSSDEIKIVYNKLASNQNQSVSTSNNQSLKTTRNDIKSASQTQSPHISYQEHNVPQRVAKERPEPQNASIPPISLPIISKPMPIQAPIRPAPVLMVPPVERVDQQKAFRTSAAECIHPIKRTSPQVQSASPGYPSISSYQAPPKSLREEVEYRKRELMYLDQLARKREKEFERLQNIRKSKIRLLKLLENRIPIPLNKECSAQNPVPYYYCSQGEKTEAWTNQSNAQLVPSEKSTNNIMQSPPGTTQIPNVWNSYQHCSPPNDRIKYELNDFISSFNTQMQQIRKESLSRKEHDISLSREPPQNVSVQASSIPGLGMSQNSSLPTTSVAKVLPDVNMKNRMVDENPRTILPPTNYVEKASNCQTNHIARSSQLPPQYSVATEVNKYQNLPVTSQRNYPTCQFQNTSSYNTLYTGSSQKISTPARLYDQPIASSQSCISNQQWQQKNKDNMTDNAQQQYYGNKAWPDQRNWHRYNMQKSSPVNAPPYQPDSTIPPSFWPVAHPQSGMFSGSQRLKMQPDIVQQRTDSSSVGLVFVDASKTSHVCSYCNGNAIFLCSSCKKAWYCGRECQRRSWAQHSTICVGD